jgi:DNA polymerase-3 subunit beta
MPSSVLAPALAALAQVAHRASSALPVLSGVLTQVKPDAIRFTAFNMIQGLEITLQRTGDGPYEPGACVIGAELLHELVKSVSGDVTLEGEDGGALVRYVGGEARLGTVPDVDFPKPPFARTSIEIAGETLRHGFERVAYAADRADLASATSGVRVAVSGGEVRFLATDRHRVASYTADAQGVAEAGIVVPTDALGMIARLCDAERVRLGWDEHGVTAVWKSTRLYSRVPAGAYPDVESRLPAEYASRAVCRSSDLRTALVRVGLTAEEYVTLRLSSEGITLESFGPAGATREVLAAEVSGEGTIHFNPAFLTAALSHLDGENVTFEMIDAEHAGRLSSDEQGSAVVMPIMPAAIRRVDPGEEAVAS